MKKEGKIEVKNKKIATQSEKKRKKGIGWYFSLASYGMRLPLPVPTAGRLQWQILKKVALWNCMEMCLQGKGVMNLSFLATQKAVTQILPCSPYQAEASSETQALK